ncbi:hypothetical protein FRB95_010885 [Tulasnella sp. JGI-2019a]|nr:hypothetical protein FRB95_010885 [Tulasnella sp. JGI-2019a]
MEQMLSVRTALFPVSHRIAILSFVDFWSHGINSFTEGLVAPNLHTFHSFREHPEHETLQYNPPLTLMNLTLVRFTLQRTAISPGSLRTLHLVSTSFSHTLGLGTLLEVLRNCPSLETLSLELIRGLGAPVERGVVELPKLRSLSLSQIRVNAFKTLCGTMHNPSLQTTRIRFIKSIEDRFDGSWLGSILDPREPSSVFIGRWLQQAPKITLVLSSNTSTGKDFDSFNGPGLYLHLGDIPPGLVLHKLEALYLLESIQAPITLKIVEPAPHTMDAELLGSSIVRLPTLSSLLLQRDYMVRDLLTRLASPQLVTTDRVYTWPCPKLKDLGIPASTTMGDTFVLGCIQHRYAALKRHTKPLSEPPQSVRLENLGVYSHVGEESTWAAFVNEVANLTDTRPSLKVPGSMSWFVANNCSFWPFM